MARKTEGADRDRLFALAVELHRGDASDGHPGKLRARGAGTVVGSGAAFDYHTLTFGYLIVE